MLEISKLLFSSWNIAQLNYCHWKSNEHLMPGLDGDTDLDVLLSDSDKLKGEEILNNLDFLQCKSQYGSRYPGVDDWIGFDKKTGKLIHIHLHYHIVTGHRGMKEYNIPWSARVLSSRIKDSKTNVYIANPNVEIVTLYTRIALKVSLIDLCKKTFGRYRLDKSYLVEIDYLKQRISWEDVEEFVKEFYGGDANKVLSIMKKDVLNKEDVFILRKIAEKTFRKVSRHEYTNRIIEFYFTCALKYRKFLRQKLNKFIVTRKVPKSEKGLQVVFLGQDGAGKTTVSAIIQKWWSWKMDARLEYLGSGDNYFSWRKTLLKKLPHSFGFKPIRVWLSITIFSKLSKDNFQTINKGEKYANKGGLVIYDRYPQVRFPGINDGPKVRLLLNRIPTKLRWLFEKYAKEEELNLKKTTKYNPDVVFKLIIPPEESVRRKPGHALDTMVIKHQITKALQFDSSDVYEIDATMPFDEEILLIKKTIWNHIRKNCNDCA